MEAILAISVAGALWRPQGPWIALAAVAGLVGGYLFGVLGKPWRGGDDEMVAAQATVAPAGGSADQVAHRDSGVANELCEGAAAPDTESAAPVSRSNEPTAVDRLAGANLNGARLRGANLRGLDLRATDLRNADLSGADLSHAQFGNDTED